MNQEEHHHHHHKNLNRRQLIRALFATTFFMIIELLGGFYTHSMALTSDALHLLTDVAALGLALLAAYLSQKKNHEKIEHYAAYLNAFLLIVLSASIIIASWERLSHPTDIKALEAMGIGFLGLIFNIIILKVLSHAHFDNINIRSATLHVIGDLVASIGVIIAAALVHWFELKQADAVVSIFISVLIIFSTVWVFKSSHETSV